MVGLEAARYVQDGMIVGLGTGSTAYYMIEELGRRVREEQLAIIGVPTSSVARQHAEKLGIPLKTIDQVKRVDLTIDGADEISADFHGIKGGGAALLFEKIVATYSDQVIWIVDEAKMVTQLGQFPLPVEVVPYGQEHLFRLFEAKGYRPTFRMLSETERKVTDSGHAIIDLHLGVIDDPLALSLELDALVGVVEHGLFLNLVQTVIVGTANGPQTIQVAR